MGCFASLEYLNCSCKYRVFFIIYFIDKVLFIKFICQGEKMKIKHGISIRIVMLIVIILSSAYVSCIFSPKTGKKKSPPTPQWLDPISPRNVINNLQVAFNLRDIDFFERCLHENYYYISPSQTDSLNIQWPRSDDILAVKGVMEKSREIIFTPSEINIYEEYGANVPNIPETAVLETDDEHPDDIWWICDYYITIDIFTNDYGDFKAQQDMKFKMIEDTETKLYSIIQWYDETPDR